LRVVAGLAVAALAALAAAAAGTSATDQAQTLVIWADADRVPAVTQVANGWAANKGVTVQVVQKQMGPIRQEIATVATENAPDVIVGAHDWVGELSSNGSVVPLSSRSMRSTRSRTARRSRSCTAPRWRSRTSRS
jgi:arabinogalactan oligomer/maltooligosaccharide transport system substrate-binding protein